MPELAEVINIHQAKQARKKKSIYPINRDTLRPFRLWDAKAKKQLQWRNYAFVWSALDGAWKEMQWVKINTTIEVYDTTTGNHIASFTMKPGHNVHRFVKPAYNVRFKGKRK